MKLALKWLYRIVLIIVALILILATYLYFTLDLEKIKTEISELVNDKTGLHLHMNGDVNWKVYPVLGLGLQDVSLKDQADKEQLLGAQNLALGVEFLPLLANQVNLQSIVLNELQINYQKNADGSSNFDPLINAGKSDQNSEAAEQQEQGEASNKKPPEIKFKDVLITDSQIEFKDNAANSHFSIGIEKLLARSFALKKPFNLELIGSVSDNKKLNADINSKQTITVDTENKKYLIESLIFDGLIEGPLKKPLALNTKIDAIELIQQASGIKAEINNTKITADVDGIMANTIPVNAELDFLTLKQSSENIIVDISNILTNLKVPDIAKNKQLPVQLKSSKLTYNKAQDSVTLAENSKLQVDDLSAVFDLAVSNLTGSSDLNGKIDIDPINLKSFLAQFTEQPIQTTDNSALSHFDAAFALSGNKSNIQIKQLDMQLDDTTLTGGLSFQPSNKATWFDLNIDAINADRYLPPKQASSDEKQTADTATANSNGLYSDKPVLPIDKLNTLLARGDIKIGTLQIKEETFKDINCALNATDGIVRLKNCGLIALDGKINTNITINTQQATPTMQIKSSVEQLKMQDIISLVIKRKPMTGMLFSDANLQLTGNSVNDWISQLNGDLNINLNNGLLRGLNFKEVLANNLGAELTTLIELGLANKGISIPKRFDEDTAFSNIKLPAKVRNGNLIFDTMNIDLDGGDSLTGKGQFNLANLDFDYQLNALLPSLLADSLPKLKDTQWPIRCNGNLLQPAIDWCGLNTAQTDKIITAIAKREAQAQILEGLNDKLGLGLGETKDLEQAAKEKVEERIQEQTDKIQEQVQDKIKDKIGDELGDQIGDELGNKVKDLFKF